MKLQEVLILNVPIEEIAMYIFSHSFLHGNYNRYFSDNYTENKCPEVVLTIFQTIKIFTARNPLSPPSNPYTLLVPTQKLI